MTARNALGNACQRRGGPVLRQAVADRRGGDTALPHGLADLVEIIDGVDAAPAGWARRMSGTWEPPVRPAGITTGALQVQRRRYPRNRVMRPKSEPETEIAAKAWALFAPTAGRYGRYLACGVPAHPFSSGSGMTASIPGSPLPLALAICLVAPSAIKLPFNLL